MAKALTEQQSDRIACVLNEIQYQLRALVYVARRDISDSDDAEAIQTLAENISMRCYVMLDECHRELGSPYALDGFRDAFEDLDQRRRKAGMEVPNA
jgi:hypothetical protein